MIERAEFTAVENRVDALEAAMAEIQTLVKILKPIAILLGASIGIDVHSVIV